MTTLRRKFYRQRAFVARVFRGLARRVEVNPSAGQTGDQWVSPSMPAWVRDEILALSHIEPDLLDADDKMDRYAFYSIPSNPTPGEVYSDLLEQVGDSVYTHVLLLPWLKPGGADRGALYHMRAILEALPSAKILVIATEPAESPWKGRVPDGVTYVEFGLFARHIDFQLQMSVLTRLLVQLRPAVAHIINSRVGWEAVKQHGMALRQYTRWFASLFCDDYTERGVAVGYARSYLRNCYSYFDRIFCDNSRYPKIWAAEIGIPFNAFEVLPFPYDRPFVHRTDRDMPELPRVLWAGRLDRQKRPDLLARIARVLPQFHFDVHGTSVIAGGEAQASELKHLPNVTLHGVFHRLEDIVRPDHIAYLHTTAWEGMPTILFDVAAAGVPIVAPAVGGIADFIDERFLVTDCDDVAAYAEQLKLLACSVEERVARRDAQYAELSSTRTWEGFVARIRLTAGYLAQTNVMRAELSTGQTP